MSKGGGQGSFAQMQEPGMGMDMGGFGGGVPQTQPFNEQIVRMDDQQATNIQPMPMPLMQNQGPDNIGGGLGSKGGRSNPYQTDGIVPPTMRGQPLPGRRQFDPINQPIARPDPAPRRTNRYTDAEYSNAEAQAREILGLPPKSGGTVYAGGTPNFDERTGEYRTGGIKPPREPVKLEPIKMQPMPTPAPERINLPAIPDYMREDLESRGTVGPRSPNPDAPFGMGSKGGRGGGRGMASGIGGKGGRGDPVGRGSFEDMIDRGRFSPGSRGRPPVFGPPRNFPFPMPKPPSMPPRQPPRVPGRNTQFQMPFFGSQYGRMNPYQGQFSGYGVPSNIYGFDQPHYQPYVPPPPAQSAPPVMQLPPGQGGNQVFSGAPAVYTPPPPVSFGGGYGGIGGFGRYNLGLAGSQFR